MVIFRGGRLDTHTEKENKVLNVEFGYYNSTTAHKTWENDRSGWKKNENFHSQHTKKKWKKKERHGSPCIRIVCPGNPTGFNIYSPAHIVSIEMAQKHRKKRLKLLVVKKKTCLSGRYMFIDKRVRGGRQEKQTVFSHSCKEGRPTKTPKKC